MRPDEAERKQRELYRTLTGGERLRLGGELYDMARRLLEAGIRQRCPEYSADQVRAAVARTLLSPAQADAVLRHGAP